MTPRVWNKGTFENSVENSTDFHVIVSGRLKVFQIDPDTGREYTVFILSKGDVFDVLHLMDSELHDVGLSALDELELLRIGYEEMKKLIVTNSKHQRAVFAYLADRMRRLEEAATDISLHTTMIRLAKLLLKNINGHSHKLELINDLPNEEIASLIGTTRAVVNRHIQELKKIGAISVSRRHIDIEDIKLLIKVAEEKYLS